MALFYGSGTGMTISREEIVAARTAIDDWKRSNGYLRSSEKLEAKKPPELFNVMIHKPLTFSYRLSFVNSKEAGIAWDEPLNKSPFSVDFETADGMEPIMRAGFGLALDVKQSTRPLQWARRGAGLADLEVRLGDVLRNRCG